MFDKAQLTSRAGKTQQTASLSNRFLYLANGSGDVMEDKFRPETLKLCDLLKNSKVAGFRFVYDALANDSHGTTALEGIPKGMVQLYRQLMYRDSRFVKQLTGDQSTLLASVEKFYADGSKWSGIALPMVWDINNLAYNSYYLGQPKTALALLKKGLAAHPEDINLYDSLGEIEEFNHEPALARNYYELGLKAVENQKTYLASETYKAYIEGFQNRLNALDKQS